MTHRALITGITGQDGTYLAEFLLEKGYEVHGVIRQASTDKFERHKHLRGTLQLHHADLLDEMSLVTVLQEVQPEEVYNLAAQTFIPTSWREPLLTSEFTALGVTRILEAIRLVDPMIRFYQAGSSEMFGTVDHEPQDEQTPFRPRNPYGVAKAYAHWLTVNYRETHGVFACSGILFNHESPLRGKEFVSRKITDAVARIKLGVQDNLLLGNLDAQRDWGFAGDYVQSMWMQLQQEQPDDFVIATGIKHTVRDLVDFAFRHADLDWRDYVEIDESLFRPAETNTHCGNYQKAHKKLGWQPTISFEEMIGAMVKADIERVERELAEIGETT